MALSRFWGKERVKIDEVKEALEGFAKAVAGKEQKAVAKAEQHLHATVMAYVRYQAHLKFPQYDKARAMGNSSDLNAEVLNYLYTRRKLPTMIEALKQDSGQAERDDFLEQLQKGVFFKIRTVPIDWARKRKNLPNYIPDDTTLDAISIEKHEKRGSLIDEQVMQEVIDQVLENYSEADHIIYLGRLYERIPFTAFEELCSVKQDAARKRFKKINEEVANVLRKRGFDLEE